MDNSGFHPDRLLGNVQFATETFTIWYREMDVFESPDKAPSPDVDVLTMRRHRRSFSPKIEELAIAYFERSEPLRDALNSVLGANHDEFADRLFNAATLFPCDLNGKSLLKYDPPTLDSPRQLAQHALVRMIQAAAVGDRELFDSWWEKLRGETDAAEFTHEGLQMCAGRLLTLSRQQNKEESIADVKKLMSQIGWEFTSRIACEIIDAGATLSVIARRAISCWTDQDFSNVALTERGLLAAPDVPDDWAANQTAGLGSEINPDASASSDAGRSVPDTPPREPKRSTQRGDGQTKLIAALTNHHEYGEARPLNLAPIGNNELARVAEVSTSTASTFFNKQFGGYDKYRAICRDSRSLISSLKLLNAEYTPGDLYGRRPVDEDDRDEE